MASNRPTVGFVGLGIMGSAMSQNVLKADFPVVGYDTDPKRLEELASHGGKPAASAAEVAQQCDYVITCLPSAAALHAAVSGPTGLASAKRKGVIVTECSTLPLPDKEAAHKALAAVGMTLLDSPVSGTGIQAVRKDLLVLSSGDKAAYEKFMPVYDGFARGNRHLGDFGNGSRMKFVANLLVAVHTMAAAEAMVLAKRSGLDPELAFSVLRDSAGTSRMLEVRGPSMVSGEYKPAMMKMDLWMKDLGIIGQFAAGMSCPAPLFNTATQYYEAAFAQGRTLDDIAVVCGVLSDMAGLKSG